MWCNIPQVGKTSDGAYMNNIKQTLSIDIKSHTCMLVVHNIFFNVHLIHQYDYIYVHLEVESEFSVLVLSTEIVMVLVHCSTLLWQLKTQEAGELAGDPALQQFCWLFSYEIHSFGVPRVWIYEAFKQSHTYWEKQNYNHAIVQLF